MKTPTLLNLWMLGATCAGRVEFPWWPTAALESMKRCHELGLIRFVHGGFGVAKGPGWFSKRRVALTDEGRTALIDAVAGHGLQVPLPEMPFTKEIKAHVLHSVRTSHSKRWGTRTHVWDSSPWLKGNGFHPISIFEIGAVEPRAVWSYAPVSRGAWRYRPLPASRYEFCVRKTRSTDVATLVDNRLVWTPTGKTMLQEVVDNIRASRTGDPSLEHEVRRVDLPNANGEIRTVVIRRNQYGQFHWTLIYPGRPDHEVPYSGNTFADERSALRSARRFMKTLGQ